VASSNRNEIQSKCGLIASKGKQDVIDVFSMICLSLDSLIDGQVLTLI
jgi:hypothetical protein